MGKTITIDISKQKKLHRRLKIGSGTTMIVLHAAKNADATIEVELPVAGATVTIVGIVAGNKNTAVNLKTIQHHQAPHTTSDLLIKSVLDDASQFMYEGLIRVEKKAQGTNAYQKNDALMLSSHAHIETKPSLEILANDVRCTHGATIGTVDKEQLFYLQSRGIGTAAATQMIISGFLTDVLERIDDKEIRGKLKAQMLKLKTTT